MEPRPKAVTVVAVFLFAATAIAFIVGASLLFPSSITGWLWQLNRPAESAFRTMGRLSGIPLLILGIATFAAAKGLRRGESWAWWFSLVLFVVNGIGDVVSLLVTGDWARSATGVVIASAFVWVLAREDVRRYVARAG